MRKLFILLFLFITSVSSAYELKYEDKDGTVIYFDKQSDSDNLLSVGRGEIQYAGNMSIPAEVSIEGVNYIVTEIGEQAFMGCPELVSISMPETITAIGSQAFDNDFLLESVMFSENIVSIGESAFNGCAKLKQITLPSKLTYIAPKIFQNCSELEEIVIPSSVGTINNSDYGNNPFGGCTKLKKVVVESLESWFNLTLYGGTQPFDDFHLYVGDQEIKDLVIPESVTSIRNYAFQCCTGLESITIPEHVASIGRCAFDRCGKLKKLTVSDGIHSFGNFALSNCYPEIIEVPNLDVWINNLSPNIMANGNTIFHYQLYVAGELVENLVLPEGVSIVGERAFCGCNSIKTLSFPYTTTSLSYLSFGYCEGLESVNIRDGITSLGESSFESCTKLRDVTLPNSISEVSPFCFAGCTNLKSIAIPQGVKRIRGSAFSGCTSLEAIDIPESVKEIGGDYNSFDDWKQSRVFNGCTSLKNIEIPDGVEYIGSFSFMNCTNLTSIKLSDNLKYISRQCFQGCEKLRNVTIGTKTTSIGYGSFWNCTSLRQIICNALEPPTTSTQEWSSYYLSFKGVDLSNVNLYVPVSAVETYAKDYPWNSFSSITGIGDANMQEIPKCATPIISIGDGQLTFSSETEGVEYHWSIINTNGTSGTGNIVPFSQTFTVSVYSSKTGWLDSEESTVIFRAGDVNGDGVINAADIVIISNIIMGKD